jgi:hypothetical protein
MLLGAVVFSLWVAPLGSSFWLDETVTAWVIQDGYDTAVERGSRFSGGNPTYYVIVWAFAQFFGTSELALRTPSMLAMLGCLVLFWRLARDIRDRETGLIATIVFACVPLIAFEARNARTYAIGLFFTLASWVVLRRWVQTWRYRDAALHAFCLAMVFHIHYLLSLVALVNGVQVIVAMVRQRRVPYLPILASIIFFAIFCAPSYSSLVELFGRKASLIVVPSPSYRVLWKELFPEAFGAALFMGLFASAFVAKARVSESPKPLDRLELLVLAAQWLALPVLVFLISRYTYTRIFIPRYFISSVAGMALVLALGVRSIGPPRVRLVMVATVAVISAIGFFRTEHHDNNWKNLNAAIRQELKSAPDLEILAHTGLVEAKDLSWFEDPESRAYLNSPFAYYPVGKDVIPLPFSSTPEDREYMQGLLDRILKERKGFMVVSRRAAEFFNVFFMSGLSQSRYKTSRIFGTFGNLTLYRFDPNDE